MGRRNNPSHPSILNPDLRNLDNFKMDALLYLGLAFSGSLGEKTAEHRLSLLTSAFGTFVLLFFPLFYGKGNGILFTAIQTLEFIVWHLLASFLIFMQYLPIPRRTPDLDLRLLRSEKCLPIRVLTSTVFKTVGKYNSRRLAFYGIQSRSAFRSNYMKLLIIFRLQDF